MPRPLLALLCTLALVVALAAGGCGDPGGGPSDGGSDGGGDAAPEPSFFGLAEGRCFRYDVGGGNLYFTLETRRDETTIRDVPTWQLIWRNNGMLWRTDWVEVTSAGLKIHRRNFPPALSTPLVSELYSPAAVVVPVSLAVGRDVETRTTAKRSAGSSPTDVDITFRVTAEDKVEVTAAGQTGEATKFLVAAFSGSEAVVDRWWLTPEVGFVRVDPNGRELEVLPLAQVDGPEAGDCVP